MSIQSALRETEWPSARGVPVNHAGRSRHAAIARLIGMLWLGLSLSIFVIVGTARLGAQADAIQLPPGYLPGQPLPDGVICHPPGDEPDSRCVYRVGSVEFAVGSTDKTIIRTTVAAPGYRLGDLMLAWGRPTGVQWGSLALHVYWGTRSALIYDKTPRPDSRVEFIIYEMKAQPASAWRGFTSWPDRTA